MSVFRRPLAVALGVAALCGTALVPFAYAMASSSSAYAQEYVPQPAPVAAPEPLPSAEAAPATTSEDATAPALAEPAAPAAEVDQAELLCLAKVVVHEAGNQSRTGQLAVAQVVMNRVRSPRFPDTVCGVVMQRGQFFNVYAYNPPRDARWRTALEVARDALTGASGPVIGEAVFFHAASAGTPFRGRPRVGQIGNHIFYR